MTTSDKLDIKRFFGDIIFTFLRQGGAIFLGLGISVLLARGLGTEGQGIYALALLVPTIIFTFTNLGIMPATVYHVAHKNYSRTEAIRGNLSLAVWVSIIGLCIGWILIYFGSNVLLPDVPHYLLYFVLLALPLLIFNNYLMAILQGLEDFKAYNTILILPQLTTLFFVFILVLVFDFHVFGALVAYIGGQLASFIACFRIIKGKISMIYLWPNKEYTREMLSYGLKSYLANATAFLNYRADMFLLSILSNPEFVGLYTITVVLAERLWLVSQTISTVLFPRIAAMYEHEASRKILTPLIARHILWLTIVIAVFIYLFAEWGITLLYSDLYYKSALALQILLPGIVFTSMSRILANDIAGRGRPEINTIQAIIAFIINVVANMILIPILGINGAALASTISYICLAIMKIIAYSQLTGVPWYKTCLLTYADFVQWKKAIGMLHTRFRPSWS